jgi:hypothetical protein
VAASYYEVLGVAASASPDEIRVAYRQRARTLHPDRQVGLGPWPDQAAQVSLREMQALNEAWRVLGDEERRRAYDRLLSGAGAGTAGPGAGARWVVDDEDQQFSPWGERHSSFGVSLVRGLPWLAVLVILGGIFVFTAFAGGAGSGGDDAPTASDLVGSCVQLERGGVVNQVPCDGPSDGRVDLVAVRASLCPEGADVARLASQESWLCLRDPSQADLAPARSPSFRAVSSQGSGAVR